MSMIAAAMFASIMLQVDTKSPGKPINDRIYGRNDISTYGLGDTDLTYPLIRFGGNPTSVYNWKENAWNAGSDWFFLNVPLNYSDSSGAFKGRFSLSDSIILSQASLGQDSLITVPMMGWVAKGREKAWSYSVKKYGKQQATEQGAEEGEIGNGKKPDGSIIKGNSVRDAYRDVGPDFVSEWVRHNLALRKKWIPKAKDTRFYALDNEPSLWHETHQDIRYGDPKLKSPELGYDELWDRTLAYATAIREADPSAKILGPGEWGYCGYISSAKDKCKRKEDHAAHGSKDLLPWYMQKVCEHKKKTGVQLVDYLDIHYYSQVEKDFNSEGPSEQGKRLEATRPLFEKGFRDGSWLPEPMELIPRMKKWIREECPGLGLAITEYRFGAAPEGITSAMANAEAMAIFGREGVDLATYWGHIPKDTKLEGAFALYLDYDGKGASARKGLSQALKSSDPNTVSAFAIRSGDRLLIYSFNKSTKAQDLQWQGLEGWDINRAFQISKEHNLKEVSAKDIQHRLAARTANLMEFKAKPQGGGPSSSRKGG